MCNEGDLLTDINVGRIHTIVVQANIGIDCDAASGGSTSSQDVEQGGFTGATVCDERN